MSYSVQNIRNVCLLGHSGSGKTSLAESLLFITGAIDRMGRDADGNTVCDYDPEEVKRGIFRSSQYFHAFSTPTDTPSLAEATIMAASAARRASITSPEKSNAPGVSSTLMRQPL